MAYSLINYQLKKINFHTPRGPSRHMPWQMLRGMRARENIVYNLLKNLTLNFSYDGTDLPVFHQISHQKLQVCRNGQPAAHFNHANGGAIAISG